MERLIVIGGGPSGLLAAGVAGQRGKRVLLFEKNPVLGKKLLLTGKGRCNLTNILPMDSFMDHIIRNKKFLYTALHTFSNKDLQDFFSQLHVPMKVERGGRVFPVSDKAAHVLQALQMYIKRGKVEVRRGQVTGILVNEGRVTGVSLAHGEEIEASKVILATGGLAYPGTGSTGDGYGMARDIGHEVTSLRPSLVPIKVSQEWVLSLHGLKLKNITLKIQDESGKKLYQGFGEVHFCQKSLSGPLALTASSLIGEKLEGGRGIIDLKPALTEEKLEKRIKEDFLKYQRKDFANSLGDLLPSPLQGPIVTLSQIPGRKKVNQITKNERGNLVYLLKNLEFSILGLSSFHEAIVTCGGIHVEDVNPKTMESKKVKGLFFAGEILDVDGLTGGYNLQLAFSTGYLAGANC